MPYVKFITFYFLHVHVTLICNVNVYDKYVNLLYCILLDLYSIISVKGIILLTMTKYDPDDRLFIII
jgi:hypothetical protein